MLSPEAEFQLKRADERLAARRERERRLLEGAARAAAALKSEFGATRVLLFGSVGRAWFHDGSDLDLAVEGVVPSRISEAWERISEIVGLPTDLVAIEEAPPLLREHILRSGRDVT